MGKTATALRSAIRVINGLVNLFVLIMILLLLTFSCYAIWDSNQIYNAASASNYNVYRPSTESISESFEELKRINPDVFSWLTVYGTNIDYPVAQGQDNFTYVNTDIKGNHSLSGAIFLDYRCSPDFSDFVNILYGHHMENQVMFGEIADFSDKTYFDARKHGSLFIDDKKLGLEFFAFVQADAYDFDVFRVSITQPEEQQAYLEMLLEMAIHSRLDVSVTIDDQILLLSTCSPDATNGREILIGKITDKVTPNPFANEVVERAGTLPMIDELSTFWMQASLWIKASIVIVPLLLILLLIVLMLKKRQRRL